MSKTKCEWCSGSMPKDRQGLYCEKVCEREANAYKLRVKRAKAAGRPVPERPAPRSSPTASRVAGERARRAAVKAAAHEQGYPTVSALLEAHGIRLPTYSSAARVGIKRTSDSGGSQFDKYRDAGILDALRIGTGVGTNEEEGE